METIVPTSPKSQKVFWNWDILWSCNYRCSYCFFAKNWEYSAEKNTFPGIAALCAAWDRIYKLYGSCHVHIAGGEPFIYPDFMDLLEFLGKRHTLEMSTNLSFDVNELMRRVPPGQIKLAPSFHNEFVSYDVFLGKIKTLKSNGYGVGVTMVAAPRYLKKYAVFKRMFEEEQLHVTLVPLRGKFQGKFYPDAYTDEEKTLLQIAIVPPPPPPPPPEPAAATSPAPAAAVPIPSENPSKIFYDWHVDKAYEDMAPSRMCNMGSTYGKIHPNGDVLRCCTPGVEDLVRVGNIFDENFRLLDGPTPCSIQKCGCWKAMVVGDETKWKPIWTDRMQ